MKAVCQVADKYCCSGISGSFGPRLVPGWEEGIFTRVFLVFSMTTVVHHSKPHASDEVSAVSNEGFQSAVADDHCAKSVSESRMVCSEENIRNLLTDELGKLVNFLKIRKNNEKF